MRQWMTAVLVAAALAGTAAAEAAAQRVPPRPSPEATPAPPTPPGVPVRPAPAQPSGWMGITFSYSTVQRQGQRQQIAVVSNVAANSPAARAGVQRGDTVVRVNGRTGVQTRIRELRLQPGDTVRLQVRRQGREREVAVIAAQRPVASGVRVRGGEVVQVPGRQRESVVIVDGDTIRVPVEAIAARVDTMMQRMRVLLADSLPRAMRELERRMPEFQMRLEGDTVFLRGVRPEGWTMVTPQPFEAGRSAVAGAEFTELNPGLAEYFQGVREGLLVLRVPRGTPAARAGLQEGDVVVRAGGTRVRTVAELRRAVTRAERREVRLEVVRRGRPVEVRLGGER